MTTVIGFDPGMSGAFAVVGTNIETGRPELRCVVDMPTYEAAVGKKIRRRLDIRGLINLVGDLGPMDFAFVEEVATRPQEGSVGAFSFGKSAGAVEAVAWMAAPVTLIRPQVWKKAVDLPKGATKDQSRQWAIRAFTAQEASFRRKKDDGRAEAALIALAGWKATRVVALASTDRLPQGF